MNESTPTHPSSDRLRAFRAGQLAAADSAAIRRHLESCETCRATLKNLPGKKSSVRSNPQSAAPRQSGQPLSGVPDAVAQTPKELPTQFGRYRVLRRLGRGGMGSVYLAQDSQFGRLVALKVPHFTPADGKRVLERFYREARAAATLTHANLCSAYDVDQIDGIHFFAMAYIEGKPLAELIREDKPLPQRPVAVVVRKLALALAYAHAKGVIHRDLKPANIMITRGTEPVIVDFGLARLAQKEETRLTKLGAVMGTPGYMAPEQVVGDLEAMGPSCDIYSLGVILYELLTGRLPFEGPPALVLGLIMTVEPPPPSTHRPDLDPELEKVCLKAMAKKAEDRHASMGELAAALTDYLRSTSPQTAARGSATPADGTGVRQRSEELAAQLFADLATPSDTSVARSRSPRSRTGSGRQTLWPWVAAGGVAMLGILLGIVFLMPTSKGTIKIELVGSVAGMEVKVDGDIIDIKGLEEPLRLKAGKHHLLVTGKDIEPRSESFTVQPGNNPPLRVELPKPRSPFAKLKPGGLSGRKGAIRDELLREGGGNEQSEAAVELGLKWLVDRQQVDGSWSLGGHDFGSGTIGDPHAVAATTLALLPLLGAGHTHKEGAYDRTVDRGLTYLLGKQQEDGSFGGNAYFHGLATLVLCEAYGLTIDQRFKDPAQRAIDFIVSAQHPGGGWRYVLGQAGDTSASAWPFVALMTGQVAGLRVPEDTVQKVSRLLDAVSSPDGSSYGYVAEKSAKDAGPAKDGEWRSTSAIGLLCRQHQGWGPQHPKLLKGIKILNEKPPDSSLKNVYYYYYATQVMRHAGGEPWKSWNPQIRDLLIEQQEKSPDPPNRRLRGSWSPVNDGYGKQAGRLYVTSLALLTLEVYYRHVPLSLPVDESGTKE